MATNKFSAKLSGLKRTKWENKSPKQQAQYFMKVYQELGLSIPKYMLDGKMTAKQLTSNINKLTRSLQSRAKHETKRIKTESKKEKVKQNKFNEAMNKLSNLLDERNKLIDENYGKLRRMAMEKSTNADTLMAYLSGQPISFGNTVLGNEYKDKDAIFRNININNLRFSEVKYVYEFIARVETNIKQIKNEDFTKIFTPSRYYNNKFRNIMQQYINGGYIDENTLTPIINRFKNMPRYRQKAFMQQASDTMTTHYRPDDTDVNEELQKNFTKFLIDMLDKIEATF